MRLLKPQPDARPQLTVRNEELLQCQHQGTADEKGQALLKHSGMQ